MIKPLLLIVAFSVLFVACKKNNSFFEVDHFNPKTNFPDSILWLDYEDAIDSGFVIPSIRQTSNGLFNYQFTISNHGEKAQSFFYKIYYQNESYQFPILDDLGINQHEFAHENFYGSWENTAIGFVKTPVIPNDNKEHLITGSFRIVGNPRNEEKYFSSNNLAPIKEAASPEEINNQSNFIDADPNWKKQIIEKAKNNNISYTEQLYADAKYSVELSKPTLPIKKTNDRWKRNPRLGNYSIRLVVTTEDNINSKKIPESVQLINSKKNIAPRAG